MSIHAKFLERTNLNFGTICILDTQVSHIQLPILIEKKYRFIKMHNNFDIAHIS